MKSLLKYWPVLLILLAFFSGRFTASDNTDELKENWKQERKLLMEGIIKKQAEVQSKTLEFEGIKKRMKEDSLDYAAKLAENQRAYTALKRKYNEINLNRASVHELDSIVAVLYP